jgi:alpha-N-arabinofuranosidase
MDQTTARIEIDTERVISEIPRTLFGGFAEHLGRCIYGGLYDPQSPHADERGFRTDVLGLLRDEMRISVLRYPGGNFVSGYRWRDGVGPRDQRPRRRELAWKSIETNQFGTDDFIELCRRINAEPMLAVNLGTGSIADAADLVEYCNAPLGTELADLRSRHGHPQPHGVKYWCLGNEMDGPWQIGRLGAEEYGRKAREAAKLIKWQDPSAKTIVCGSSGPFMSTFPAWDRTALEIAWEHADFLSIHNYATNWQNDTPGFLAYANEFEKHIDTLATILRETKQKLGAKHDIYLSQDEWNVWYKDRGGDGRWTEAPRLCEETYNLEDALVVAQWLNVFLRKCDVLKMACLAQVVNVIAPLKTTPDALLKESTYYPFVAFSRHAHGQSLAATVTAPPILTQRFGEAPMLDVSCAYACACKHGSGEAVVFIVNRSVDRTAQTEIGFRGVRPQSARLAEQLTGTDPKASNSFARPDVVVPRTIALPAVREDRLAVKLPPLSFTMLRVQLDR